MTKKDKFADTSWMGKYREFIESIILICNRSATTFVQPAYYNTQNKLTAIQIQIMEYTIEDNSDKMSAIAERLGITRGAFSNHVTKLCKMGLMEKEHRGDNKKDLFLNVTEAGRAEYRRYSEFVYNLTFKEMMRIMDQLSEKDVKISSDAIRCFADTLVGVEEKYK